MKKIVLAITTVSILSVSASTQAAIDVCVFDILGKSGEAYKMMQDWALAAKGWELMLTFLLLRMNRLQTITLKQENARALQ